MNNQDDKHLARPAGKKKVSPGYPQPNLIKVEAGIHFIVITGRK